MKPAAIPFIALLIASLSLAACSTGDVTLPGPAPTVTTQTPGLAIPKPITGNGVVGGGAVDSGLETVTHPVTGEVVNVEDVFTPEQLADRFTPPTQG
jgi:hypothetical protein